MRFVVAEVAVGVVTALARGLRVVPQWRNFGDVSGPARKSVRQYLGDPP
jgi:hypothetical protein